jgi:hypothetical protein
MRLTITSEWEIDEEMAGTTDQAKLCAKIQELVRDAVSSDIMCHDRYEDGPAFIVGPFRSRPTDGAYTPDTDERGVSEG